MPSKLQTIIDYAQKLTVDLAEQRGVWQSYLLTAARVYKYPFPEQLLIYSAPTLRPARLSSYGTSAWAAG